MTRIEKMLAYVVKHNEFYRNIAKEYGIADSTDIMQYPILTRQQLQENRYNMFSEGYKEKYYWNQLMRKSSSGSSGVPINVYWDYSDYYSTMRVLWHKRLQYYGVHPYDKKVMFALNGFEENDNKSKIKYINDPKNILNINMSSVYKNKHYSELIDLINDFNPVWLYIRPFVLQKLLYFYKEYNKPIPSALKYIESHGEILLRDLQKEAINFFNVPVANMYGSEEANTIAYECPYHNMHILEKNLIVECYNESGIHKSGTGEAIITTLTNKAMPLIRYNQGDEIIISNMIKPCLCGSNEPVISIIKGRSLDSIRISKNIELNSIIFLEIIGEVNNHYNSIITCYKFTYCKSTGILQCFIEIDEKYRKWYINVKKAIETAFEKKIPCMDNIILKVYRMKSRINYSKKHQILEVVD